MKRSQINELKDWIAKNYKWKRVTDINNYVAFRGIEEHGMRIGNDTVTLHIFNDEEVWVTIYYHEAEVTHKIRNEQDIAEFKEFASLVF